MSVAARIAEVMLTAEQVANATAAQSAALAIIASEGALARGTPSALARARKHLALAREALSRARLDAARDQTLLRSSVVCRDDIAALEIEYQAVLERVEGTL